MKQKQALVLIAACLTLAYMGGCKGINCPTCENYSTLQGTIMDAITGERIGGVATGQDRDIEIYLVQGPTRRTPTSFIGDEDDVLVGEYSFTDIPSGGTGADDSAINEYKLVIIKKGYQRFEAKVSLIDVDNKIGNVYLFPEGFNAPDYTFEVVYNGAPVPGATVYFEPVVSFNDPAVTTSDVLAATDGYLPSLTAMTDANGQVAFAGTQLALGAAYKLIVLPVKFEAVQLALYEDGAARIIGLGNITDIISLADLWPGNKYGLYVKSISNSVDDQVATTGTLTMVFSRPVTKTGSFYAVENSPSGVIGIPGAATMLSEDGLTLTLTPNWITEPDAGETGTAITYTSLGLGGFISIKDYPGTEYDLDTLVDANGDIISLTVDLTMPTP